MHLNSYYDDIDVKMGAPKAKWIDCSQNNLGQGPVFTLDQPLFATAKIIQWNWPESYGEDKFVILLGGLHIEMATLATLGDLLDGSGWTNVLTQAGIATPGTADSFLKSAHVKRPSALSIMHRTAYDAYCLDTSEPLPFDDWCVQQVEASPQFHYWYMVMHLECLTLDFVRSIRWENCGSVQRQISQIAWRSCAHSKAKLQSSTSLYWMDLLSSTC